MTWQVEQAITPSHAPSSGWPAAQATSSRRWPGVASTSLSSVPSALWKRTRSRRKALLAPCRRVDPAAGCDQLVLGRVAAEAEADRRAGLAIVRPSARSTWLGRPEPLAQATAERKSDIAQLGDQAERLETFAAQLRLPR